MAESDDQRSKRRRQRVLFDSVADLYDVCRASYPTDIIESVVSMSGVHAGDPILEIGCGTGQLTRQLAAYRFAFTAIDLGPSMIQVARRHVNDVDVRFAVSSFEDFDAPDASFDLIVSATAFHWIDPAVAWTKPVRLLRPAGWLAVLHTVEKYDEPFGSALTQAWIKRSADGGAWGDADRPTLTESMTSTGMFDAPFVRSHTERRALSAEQVLNLEHTRATSLSYDAATRASFTEELKAMLEDLDEVDTEQLTSLTMTQLASRS